MAILLSTVMDMAFEKNCKLLQTESLAGQALPLPAGTSEGLSLFADLLSFTGFSIPGIKNEPPLSHCHVPCLPTDNTPHSSPKAAPGYHINTSDGLLSERLMKVSSRVLLQSSCAGSCCHPSSARAQPSRELHAHSFVIGRLAAFQGSWERPG